MPFYYSSLLNSVKFAIVPSPAASCRGCAGHTRKNNAAQNIDFVMSGKVVKVNNQNVAIKDFNGQRVVTFKDIDTVHERADGTARKRFNDNKNHFVEGEDFFVLTQPSEIRTLGIERPQGGVPEKVTLVTESGYLMLVKSFTDDLAWNVQRQLVKSYFKAVQQNETKRKVQSGRLSLSSVNMMVKNVMGSLERAKIEPAYIAAEVKRLYSTLRYEIMTAAVILPDLTAEPKKRLLRHRL